MADLANFRKYGQLKNTSLMPWCTICVYGQVASERGVWVSSDTEHDWTPIVKKVRVRDFEVDAFLASHMQLPQKRYTRRSKGRVSLVCPPALF